MFRPSGTHQCNPKFPKTPLKLNEFEYVICITYADYDNSNACFIIMLAEFSIKITCVNMNYTIS